MRLLTHLNPCLTCLHILHKNTGIHSSPSGIAGANCIPRTNQRGCTSEEMSTQGWKALFVTPSPLRDSTEESQVLLVTKLYQWQQPNRCSEPAHTLHSPSTSILCSAPSTTSRLRGPAGRGNYGHLVLQLQE